MQIRPFLRILALTALSGGLFCSCSGDKTIHKVNAVFVEAPVGTAPRLPYQVWVTYADRSGGWRQVKWDNALRETEEEEAALPAGTN